MLSEHNPIAELVHQVQKKWTEEASPYPELKMVRWLIKPEWARLFEGFLKLESTEHGAIPEVLVAMLSPFQREETFSQMLIEDWAHAWQEDAKTQQKLQDKNSNRQWSPKPFLIEAADADADVCFLKMLSSFHMEMVDKNMRLVVALCPRSIQNMDGYNKWLAKMLKLEVPKEITFMIFDHVGEFYFEKIFLKNPEITKTLHVNLDLDGAVKKIAKMGNPNSPEVKFRECILEMGEALQKNNPKRLQDWGEKALQVTQKSGLKALFASAHIVYAGMLFNFKQYAKIDSLLTNGLDIAKQGLKKNDPSCKQLLIQFYGYIAASKQMQKKLPDAMQAYEKQGDLAIEFQLPGMALTPYQQAYTLSLKGLPHLHEALLKKAFDAGNSLSLEEKQNSSFPAIAADYLQWQQGNQLWEEAKRTDDELIKTFGAAWKERAKKPTSYTTAKTQEPVSIN
jgi:hypothetical protein